MRTWKFITEIKAPVELVWNTITDFSNSTRWNHGISKSFVLTSGLLDSGSRIMIKSLGLTRLLTIHDFIPYESLTARIDIGSTPGMVQYKLFPYGESTLLEQTLAIVPFGALKLLSVLLRASMKMEFDSLKRWVENEHRMLRSPDALI